MFYDNSVANLTLELKLWILYFVGSISWEKSTISLYRTIWTNQNVSIYRTYWILNTCR